MPIKPKNTPLELVLMVTVLVLSLFVINAYVNTRGYLYKLDTDYRRYIDNNCFCINSSSLVPKLDINFSIENIGGSLYENQTYNKDTKEPSCKSY